MDVPALRLALLGIAGMALGAAGAAAQSVRMLDGALDPGVAVPEGSVVVIEAIDPAGFVLGEASFRTRGRKAPFDFTLGIPADSAASLRASVVLGGRSELVAAPVSVPPGPLDLDLGTVGMSPVRVIGPDSAFRCGDTRVEVRAFEDAAVLYASDRRRILTRRPAASGARYEAQDDAGTWFWSQGNAALLSLDGVEFPECAAVPTAPAPAYSAGGNEPGWRLVVEGGAFRADWDYGEKTAEGPLPDLNFTGNGYAFASGDIALDLTFGLCRDDMSGMPYPDAAVLRTGERVLRGCGGDPVDLLAGADWTVTQIDGRTDLAGAATLTFTREGNLVGTTGCNRYLTDYRLSGEGLSFAGIAATRMACAEGLMELEQAFFAALGAVNRFDLDETGALLLIDDQTGGPAIVARRAP